MVFRLRDRLWAIACTTLLMAALPNDSGAQSRPPDAAGPELSASGSSAIPRPLTLSSAIEIARRSHPDLPIAEANLSVARAESMFAKVPSFNPELEVRAARGGGSLGSGSEGSIELGISQELELWGKRGARQAVATARSQASAAEWGAALQEIEFDVRARFAHTLFLQDRLQIVDELAGLDRRVVVATQARVRDGSMTPVTGRLTELDLLRLEVQVFRARAGLRQAIVALGLAMGRDLPESTLLSGDIQADTLRAPEDSVVVVALRVRGTGEVLRRRIAEGRAELALADREARPNLTVGAGLTRERRSFSADDFTGEPAIVGGIGGVQSTDKLWNIRFSAPLPLWQRNQAGRARASAEVLRREAEYARFRLRTQMEVQGRLRRFQDATGIYRLYLARSSRTRQDLVLIRDAYADGRISLDSYLTQKGRLVETLLGQLEAGEAYWDARSDLESSVGVDLARLEGGSAR